MKKWTLRITICLILGAVTTVGVAWGCVYFFSALSQFAYGDDYDKAYVYIDAFGIDELGDHIAQRSPGRFCALLTFRSAYDARQGSTTDRRTRDIVPLPGWSNLHDLQSIRESTWARNDETGGYMYIEEGCGWPMVALRSAYFVMFDSRSNYFDTTMHAYGWLGNPLALRIQGGKASEFPLRPVLSGFLINTLFYAAIWFGLFFAPGMTRRFIRTRRGRCPRCGYDLRGAFKDGCSECGWGRDRMDSHAP